MPLLAVRPQCWQRTGSRGGSGSLVFLAKLAQPGVGESGILGRIRFGT